MNKSICGGPGKLNGECGRPVKYRGLCGTHAEQQRLGKSLTPIRQKLRDYAPKKTCAFEGCRKDSKSLGLCYGHYDQKRSGRELTRLKRRQPSMSSAERDERGHKFCSACGEWKHEEAFANELRSIDGLSRLCRTCQSLRKMRMKYGITPEAYGTMLADQGGACAICRVPQASRMAVDHDHKCCPSDVTCGTCIRGLLCWACNTALGQMEDDTERLRRAIDYLGERNVRVGE